MGVRDMIDEAHKAGYDMLGLVNDPEAVAAIEQMLGKKVLYDHIFASYMTMRACMRSILEHYDALQAPPTADQTADYVKALRDTLALCGDLLSVPITDK